MFIVRRGVFAHEQVYEKREFFQVGFTAGFH
jgi:hypothetical protein